MKSFFKRIVGQLLMVTLLLPVMTMQQAFAQVDNPEDVPPAAGAEVRNQDEVRVYYSESIGAGDRVMQITGCKKTPFFAPVDCNKVTGEKYPAQCKPDGKLQPGKRIKGCKIDAGAGAPPANPNDPRARYPRVSPEDYDANKDGCREDVTKNGFMYEQVWAVVDEANKDNPLNDRTIALPDDIASGSEASDAIKKEFEITGSAQMMQIFRPDVCAKFDAVMTGDQPGPPSAVGVTQKELGEIFNNPDPVAVIAAFNDSGCNSDNATSDVGALKRSTVFNNEPSYTCTLLERITGKSGSDLFGRYVSALYRWASSVVGIIAVLVMVVSGIQISIAGGDSGKIEEAKGRIMQSLVGIAILFLSGLFLYTINPTFFTG